MATVMDILGKDTLKFENDFKAQGLSGKELESAMVKLARDTRAQREQQSKQQSQPTFELTKYNTDSTSDKIMRGIGEAGTRGIALLNSVGLVPDNVAKYNASVLDALEKRKELDSENSIKFELEELKNKKGKNTLDLVEIKKIEDRLNYKEQLKQESANATGFKDNAVASIKTLVDVATHPSEWTTQGIVAGVADPLNAIGFGTGAIVGKVTAKIGASLMTKVGLNVADGVAVSAGGEYAVAKGTFKSDEEAKKAAIQSGAAGAPLAIASSLSGSYVESKTYKTPKEQIIEEEAYAKVLSNQFLKDEETQAQRPPEQVMKNLEDGLLGKEATPEDTAKIIDSQIKNETISLVKKIATAEEESTKIHADTKIKLQEAVQDGASLEELLSIRNYTPMTPSESLITKIINNNEPTTNRLAGFRIVSVMEETIKNGKLNADEVKKRLIDELVNPELATVAAKSYVLKDTTMLVDYIEAKMDDYMQVSNANLKTQIQEKVHIYNKQKIADEQLWTTSLTKKSLDDYISKEIGDDNIHPAQRDMLYELNKIGLVEDLVSTKLKKDINAQYDMDKNQIALNSQIPNISKAQALTHEYLHGAFARLIEEPKFNNELNFLFTEAKNSFKAAKKDINQYGFNSIHEFGSEAFSNPLFAKELNEVLLSQKAKEQLGVKKYVNTLWEAIVDKFSEVVFATTGRRMKLNPDSYLGALDNMLKKQLNETQALQEQRIKDGSAIAQELKQPIERKPTTFDNLKLHPRFNELISMREDVKATDIKYENKVLNKGTVVHDENKFGGVDKTQVVPTSYERNYNADFKLTKQDIENIKAGKIDENITQKLKDDLSTLDNHPDWKKYGDDVDVKQSKDNLGEEFDDNHYINKNGEWVVNGKVLFSKESKKRYIDSKTGNLLSQLNKDAIELPAPMTRDEFYKDLGTKGWTKIKTPIGNIRLNAKSTYDHIQKQNTYFADRFNISGAFRRILEDPLMIVYNQSKKQNEYYAPFKDKDGVTHLIDIVKGEDGNLKHITFFDITDAESKIKEIIGTNDLNTKYFKYSELGKKNLTTGKPEKKALIDESIPKPKENINNKKFPAGNLEEGNVFYSKNFPEEKKSIFEKYDALSDKGIEKLDNFFKGVTKDGKIDPNTTNIGNMLRKGFVPDSLKAKDFVQLLHETNAEKRRMTVIAKSLQEDLNKIPKVQNELLVMALDGDIPKENIKATLDPQTYELYTKMRSKVDANANELVKLGMLDESAKVEDYVKRFYKEHLENKSLIKGLFSSGHKLEKNFKRKDLTKEQRDKLNQIRDAGYVVTRTLLEQNNQIRKAKFLDTLANEYAVTEPKDGFELVPIKKDGSVNVFGNLSGKYVPKHIMDELNGMHDFGKVADNIVQKNVKNFSRWLKGTWTAGNPSTHLYNVASNTINLYLNGMIFTTKNGRAGGGSKGIDGIKKFFNKDTRDTYKEELTEAGLYDDSFFSTLEGVVDELDKTTKDNFGFKDIVNGMLFRKDSKITKAIENVYDLEDKIFRVFVYEEKKWDLKVEKYKKEFGKIDNWSEARAKIEAIDLTKDENIKAMNEARDMFVDYSKPVPEWIQWADNYMVAPFARYTYLATIRQAKTAIKHPIRALALSFGFGEALKALFGEGENLDDNDPLKSDWMKTSLTNFNMYLVQNFTKLKDTKDEATYFNTGRLIPGFRMFEATLGFYSDLLTILADKENKFGQKFVQEHDEGLEVLGRTLSKATESLLPPLFPIAVPVMWNKPRLTAGGNLKKDKDGNPTTETVVLGGRYGQKLLGAISGSALDRYGQPVPPTDVIKQILGVKLQTINKKDEAIKQLNNLEKEYKPKIQKQITLKNPKEEKKVKEEYNKKIQEIRNAVPGFDLSEKSKNLTPVNVKFDF